MAEREEKNLLMKVKEKSEKAGLKLKIKKTKKVMEDGGGIGRGDHFVPHEFMKRSLER